MTVQSDDGRLVVWHLSDRICVDMPNTDLSAQQVYDALLPLFPPPVPTAREVAEALWAYDNANNGPGWQNVADRQNLADLARRWDEAGRP